MTVEGQKHLGAVIGSRDSLQEYVNEKVTTWVNEAAQLAEFAWAQPQASYTVASHADVLRVSSRVPPPRRGGNA